jgi:hypothetical protein
MDTYHGGANGKMHEAPEHFHKNGKKPKIVSQTLPDGTNIELHINSTTGKPLPSNQVKVIQNQAKQQIKKEATQERLLKVLAKRQAEKNKK